MHTNKGYIVPVIFVIILLTVAGIFIFSQKVESPIVEQTQVATTTSQNEQTVATTTEETGRQEVKINEYSFVCSDKTEGTASFDNVNDAAVVKIDGKIHELRVGISGSGVRYVNDEETYIFWNKGNSAFIEENGTTTHEACELKAL